MYQDFIVIEANGEQETISRQYLGQIGGRNETWLRDLLFEKPQILPVGELDPAFTPLIPLCSEFKTDAGFIDALFVNPQGHLTIVECKLWKNPQAKREVVGQLLDYISALSSWSYADLQREISKAIGRQGNVPFEIANAASGQSLRETQFVDAVSKSLKEGNILGLIVGDGIRPSVQRLSKLVNRNAAMNFSFGLIEIALYESSASGQLIVQPRIVAKTKVISRQIISVASHDISMVEPVEANEAKHSATARDKQHLKDWWAPVLSMTFDDPEQEPPYWVGTNNAVLRTPWPGVFIKAYAMTNSSETEVFVSTTKKADKVTLEKLISLEHKELFRELPPGTEIFPYRSWPIRTFESEFEDDDTRRDWINETLNSYVNALRPRLDKAQPE